MTLATCALARESSDKPAEGLACRATGIPDLAVRGENIAASWKPKSSSKRLRSRTLDARHPAGINQLATSGRQAPPRFTRC